MMSAALAASSEENRSRAKEAVLASGLAGSSGSGRFSVYPPPSSTDIHFMKIAAASFSSANGLSARDHDPVGVTATPSANIGWAAIPQLMSDSASVGSSHGPWIS